MRAVQEAAKLEAAQLAELLPAALDAALRDLSKPAARSIVELAAARGEVAAALFDSLEKLAVGKLKGNFVLLLGTGLKGHNRLAPLLERWLEKSNSPDVKRQAGRALGHST